jgi:hypothetical protein
MSLGTLTRRARRTAGGLVLVSVSSLACAALGAAGTPASASTLLASCAPRPTSTAFAAWGDASSYFLAPGGGFEAGTPEWDRAGGATVGAGNETAYLNADTDSQSLAIPTGGAVTSPPVCVAMGENTIRLFVNNSGVAGSVLHIRAYVQNPLTGLVLATGVDVEGSAGATGWAPTSPILIPNLLGGIVGTQRLTLVFSADGAPATWGIDDVYVDPFKQR